MLRDWSKDLPARQLVMLASSDTTTTVQLYWLTTALEVNGDISTIFTVSSVWDK